MGDVVKPLSADMAIDCVILGQSELNDSQIDKLIGWAMWRAGAQTALPADHPYKKAAPTLDDLDQNDEPTRYVHDLSAWNAWAATNSGAKFVNRGRSAPPVGNEYKTVFFDDFAENTIVDDLSGPKGSVWYAPTHNTAWGVEATI